MNRILSFVLIFMFCSIGYSQSVQPSLSNILRYGKGKKTLSNFEQSFSYFENITDVRLAFPQSLTIGFRLLADTPPEIGDEFQGLKRRFIEFSKDDFSIRAGNFSHLFGRGLTLNLFDNRGIAYDTWMDGIKASYKISKVKATIVGGTLDFRDSVAFTRHELYKIRGGNIEFSPIKSLSIATSFLSADGKIPQGVNNTNIKNIKTEIPEVSFTFNRSNINYFVSWAQKRTNVLDDKITSLGTGMYSSLSYSAKGVGVIVDYKNYAFDIRDPYERGDETRVTKMLPFQNPPIAQKEHSYTLLTRALHPFDFNDEVGLQAETFYGINSSTTINFNASVASRHNYFDLQNDGFTFKQKKRVKNYLPTLDKKLSPYWETFLEIENYFEEHSAIRFGYARRVNFAYNDFSGIAFSHEQRSTIVPIQLQYVVNEQYSFIAQSEHEWVYDSYNAQQHYYNQLVTLSSSYSPIITAAIRYEFSTNDYDVLKQKNWLVGEFGYNFSQAHKLTISYGKERGGQACSNGVCKYIQPFTGFRMSLQSQI
ncbi:MAG: hypothetical protein KGZ58_08010 [Ignavibacteriales bacterium]|nr:hypothetical protein [Ignavibacteriales bacterium]